VVKMTALTHEGMETQPTTEKGMAHLKGMLPAHAITFYHITRP